MMTFHQRTHSPRDKGCLNGHKRNTSEDGALFDLFSVLYVDDSAFNFEDRSKMEKGGELIFSHFTKFGLEMHIGRGGKPSKTECVFFPPPVFFRVARYFRIHAKKTAMRWFQYKNRKGSLMRQDAREKTESMCLWRRRRQCK